jgi:hypothetical protein
MHVAIVANGFARATRNTFLALFELLRCRWLLEDIGTVVGVVACENRRGNVAARRAIQTEDVRVKLARDVFRETVSEVSHRRGASSFRQAANVRTEEVPWKVY